MGKTMNGRHHLGKRLRGLLGIGKDSQLFLENPTSEKLNRDGGTFKDDYGFEWTIVISPKTQLKNYFGFVTALNGELTGGYSRKFAGWKKQMSELKRKRGEKK